MKDVSENAIDHFRQVGRITKLVGLTLESHGPNASIGDLVSIHSKTTQEDVFAEVVGFRDNRVLLMPFDSIKGIACGDDVTQVNEGFRISVGDQMLGRVIDGLGNAIDGKGDWDYEAIWPVHRAAPPSMSRIRIDKQFVTGIRAIDSALSCGIGQRIGIFAGSGVGKSTILGMLCRHSDADVNVIALIGERGKEVRDFIEDSLGPEGMKKSILVVVTSDQPPLQRVRGAELAMAIAEYFRDKSKKVLLVMDSVTRFAMAQREIGLAIGEPPATKGYPPSVFSLLPRLLERAGNNDKGSITGCFTVLVEGDDLNDPIADSVRGILDGHIVLSRELAMRGHYPAIDILASISRVINNVTTVEHLEASRQVREILGTYKKVEDLINIGAYQGGTNPKIDWAIQKKEPLDGYLRQGINEYSNWDEAFEELKLVLNQH